MKHTRILAILAISLFASMLADSQQPPNTTPPDLTASAKQFISLLEAKDFAGAEKAFDSTMKEVLPEAKLRETWDAVTTQAGAFKRQVDTRIEVRGDYQVVIVACEFANATVNVEVVFDRTELVAGLFFKPPKPVSEYTAPSYVRPDTFREQQVTVGSGEWALPGTLTLPIGKGPYPAVVLVHGSGPEDRDETIGPNKPFRDLAWGLASQGIAVLRYEKRTLQHQAKFASLTGLTVKEETIDDALAAVALLRTTPGIKPNNIFVIGHSLGGTLVPRIGLADSKIAGFVVLAGAVRPIEDLILEQSTYILSLDGTISPEEAIKLEEVKQEVAKIKKLTAADANSSLTPFGVPAAYWLDLRGYDSAKTAQKLKQPMLVLQGERDYQVTMVDFQLWRAALNSRRNVTFRSFPNLNHLFIEGTGKSAPAEYNLPGHVAEVVITEISSWIKK